MSNAADEPEPGALLFSAVLVGWGVAALLSAATCGWMPAQLSRIAHSVLRR